jgi:hypothetical protein
MLAIVSLPIPEVCRARRELPPRRRRIIERAKTRHDLEAKGVTFLGETLDAGVCHMAFFTDPDEL